jgi:hypothetical protein
MKKLKKGERNVAWFLSDAYRFRSIRMITRPITTIAIMAAAPMPKTYVSVMGTGVGAGAGVASGASITVKAVTAREGQ